MYVGAPIFSSLRGVFGLNHNEEAAVLGHETSMKIHADGDKEILWAYGAAMISYNNIAVWYYTIISSRGKRDAPRQGHGQIGGQISSSGLQIGQRFET